MIKNAALIVVVLVILLFAFVAQKDGHFHYVRSGVINAPAEKIFPYLSEMKKSREWSPYEKMDPNMKVEVGGTEGQPGNFEDFESSKVGAGRITVEKVEPNKRVDLELTMTKPVNGSNHVTYALEPQGDATKFTWEMQGEGPFLMKLIGTFFDCEKMTTQDWVVGIANLKALTEKK